MIEALTTLLAALADEEKRKYKSDFVRVRTVAHVGRGAHSPEVETVEVTPEPTPPGGLPQVASATLLLDLEADTGFTPALWADQSGNGNDFTQSDASAQPTTTTIDGYPVIEFDGVDDWMLGANFADNLPAFAVIYVGDVNGLYMSKIGNDDCQDPGSTGWIILSSMTLYSDASNYISQYPNGFGGSYPWVVSYEVLSAAEIHAYVNGVLVDGALDGGDVTGTGAAGGFGNSEPIRLAIDGAGGNCDGFSPITPYAYLIYQITDFSTWDTTDRAAITAWIAARYGVML